MIPASSEPATAPSFPAELADRCVKCGLCLPECPTYVLSRHEAESPRGRIGLMQALAAGAAASDALVNHLEKCLACRRCEAVCPAQVPYGALIDAARAELARQGRPPPMSERALVALVRRPALLRWVNRLARLAVWLRLPRLLRPAAPARLRRLLDLLPPPRQRLPQAETKAPPTLPRVALFTGCLGPALEPDALSAGQRVLRAAGYTVVVPKRQVCCGALPLHSGDPARAAALARVNAEAFAAADAAAIAFTASGCGATLQEQGVLPGTAPLPAAPRDLMELLAEVPLGVTAPPGTVVALHEPCTQRNVVGAHAATVAVLARAGARCIDIGASGCCGAAGAYLLREPQIADTLLQRWVAAIAAADVPTLATTNVGCAAHLRAGLRRAGCQTRVVHPAVLLAQWLGDG